MSENVNPEIEITDEDVEGHSIGTVRFQLDEEEMFGPEDVEGHTIGTVRFHPDEEEMFGRDDFPGHGNR